MKIKTMAAWAALMVLGGAVHAGGPGPAVEAPGVVVAEVSGVSGAVDAVDLRKRTVSLKLPQGRVLQLKVRPDLRSFEQLRKGERVSADVLEPVAVSIRRSGAPPGAAEARLVSVAPKGKKPAVLLIETASVAGRLLGVDLKTRRIRLDMGGGRSRTLAVDRGVKRLGDYAPGEDIALRVVEAMVIDIRKGK
jgi:hypothetical protein